ncbi:uncharacterized protein MICPUCDRAFT_22355 [Micromonas pusilla CCMP1545]|uniref:Predicted protein n=1 Tax=Micromonas pusilla (strain CCMP1545) TaxID=564608 RepID=C1N5Q4_MICPC|nr:uncharacterized protein MICPUCDRAFT_22355 [Micromonas pusilla CCMP1545]EEH52336.1 predicted protein [Micromonas pusilla CCMP1545]|eukprot:XP_003063200.1 predicted protein [Micromonas pusilla CCMP1545]
MPASTCFRECCVSDGDGAVNLREPAENFTPGMRLVHDGPASAVFAGRFGDVAVAVKKPRLHTKTEIDRYHVELRLMLSLRHPNVLTVCAARAHPPEYFLVFPWQAHGSVAHLTHDAGWRPTTPALLKLLRETAAALEYLHARGIVHRDVKPANVLMGADMVARLADFGLAEEETVDGRYVTVPAGSSAPSGGFQRQHMVGSLAYMAPEVLMRRVATYDADAYAFGVYACEGAFFATGVAPYSDRERNVALAHTIMDLSYNEADLAIAIASEGLRPRLPGEDGGDGGGDDDVVRAVSELIRACWSQAPAARPKFPAVARTLDDIAAAYNVARGAPASAPLEPVWRARSAERDAAADAADEVRLLPVRPRSRGARRSLRTFPVGRDDQTTDRDPHPRAINAGVWATHGARGADKMEDRHVVIRELGGIRGAHLLGVFDGHRGHVLSHTGSHTTPFARSSASRTARARARARARNRRPPRARGQTASHTTPRRRPGCTACVALLWGDDLYVANAGDCRAVLCRDYDAGSHVALSVDHAAGTNASERERIAALGGTLTRRIGGWRVGDAGLAVTRRVPSHTALGDADVKRDGVIATPEVTRTRLDANDAYVVLACDGLWDVCSNEDVVSMIRDTVKEPSMCAKRLGAEALTRASGDNITVVVAFVKDVSTAELVTWERAF